MTRARITRIHLGSILALALMAGAGSATAQSVSSPQQSAVGHACGDLGMYARSFETARSETQRMAQRLEMAQRLRSVEVGQMRADFERFRQHEARAWQRLQQAQQCQGASQLARQQPVSSEQPAPGPGPAPIAAPVRPQPTAPAPTTPVSAPSVPAPLPVPSLADSVGALLGGTPTPAPSSAPDQPAE